MAISRLFVFVAGCCILLSGDTVVQADERILTFPVDNSVGNVTVTKWPSRVDGNLLFERTSDSIGKAQGKVSVPSDAIVGVSIGSADPHSLEWLDSLPSDALQALRLNGVPISSTVLNRISRQTSLVRLQIKNCQFEANCFQDVPGLPQLQQLDFSSDSLQESGYAKWAAKLPQLRNLFTYPRPELPELRALDGHPTLEWTTIALNSDANETMQQLGRMPALRHLAVILPSDKEVESVDPIHFAALSNLQAFSWFFGTLDGEALKALGSNQKLEHLTLLQVEVEEDLLEGLASLKKLKTLSLASMDDLPFTTGQLIETLAKLPDLKSWPTLRWLSSKDLKQIAKARYIEELKIAGVRKDVSLEDLEVLGELSHLKHLRLGNARVNDDWLQCLKGLRQLEYLHLSYTEVLGHGFESLGDLSSLQRVEIFFGYIDDEDPVPALGGLKTIPNLQRLRISGHFSPPDLLPLSELTQL